jgi:hypothetical protein
MSLLVDASEHELDSYVTGSVTVDMNPEQHSSSAVLVANARYTNSQLFNASSICFTRVSNTTEIRIHVCIACS